MPDDPTTRRQRAAQKAIKAIAESGDDPTVILAELARVRSYLDRCWYEVPTPKDREVDDA